jgi:endonuclease/exonuclease/phosphatase (EEP) superfamily protein YafD
MRAIWSWVLLAGAADWTQRLQALAKRIESSGEAGSVEAGSSMWMQFMLFQQRNASNTRLAQQGTRKVFMQARFSCACHSACTGHVPEPA